jgi:hypothetical protein
MNAAWCTCINIADFSMHGIITIFETLGSSCLAGSSVGFFGLNLMAFGALLIVASAVNFMASTLRIVMSGADLVQHAGRRALHACSMIKELFAWIGWILLLASGAMVVVYPQQSTYTYVFIAGAAVLLSTELLYIVPCIVGDVIQAVRSFTGWDQAHGWFYW